MTQLTFPAAMSAISPLKRWSIHIAAGKAPIVVSIGQTFPSFMLEARDVRFRTFALGIQGIEFLLKALLGRFARVDRAANAFFCLRFRCCILHFLPPFVSPK